MDLIRMSISAGVLILAIIVIRSFTANKLPKEMFNVLWVIVLLRLLLPIAIPAKISIWKAWNSIRAEILLLNTAETPRVAGLNPNVNTHQMVEMAGSQSRNLSVYHIIWLTVTVTLLFYFLVSYVRSYHKMQEALPIHNNLGIDKWQQNNRLKRKIKVMVSDRISTPITYGIISPKIILPKIMDFSNDKQLEYILTHEKVHIKRCDNLWKIVSVIALCIHWFNPLVWVMFVLFNRDLEIACDDKVISILGESEKQAYALALINLAEKKTEISLLYNGFGRNAIQERIVSIMKYKKTTILGIGCAVLLIAASTTVFATAAENNKKNEAANINADNSSDNATTTDTASAIVMSMRNSKGEVVVSEDGKTWISAEEYEAAHPTPDVEWYTYDEYKEFIEESKITMQEMVKEKAKCWNPTDGWYVWTQEISDRTLKMYEGILEDIKNGIMVSKTVDGKEDVMVSYNPGEVAVSQESSFVIASDNGEIKEFNGTYDSREAFLKEVKKYCEEQMKAGKMTQKEVDKIIKDSERQ